jgi:uncharacterized protein YbjQ (UPF0145 family)
MDKANFHVIVLSEQLDFATLSAQMTPAELYALRAAGYEPLQIVVGVAAISMGTSGLGRSVRNLFEKGHVRSVSETAKQARIDALREAEAAGKELGAHLVLVHHWEVKDVTQVVEVTCIATACKKVGDFTPMPIATSTN